MPHNALATIASYSFANALPQTANLARRQVGPQWPALIARAKVKAPRTANGCGPGRSMRATLTAKGMAPRLVQAWLNANARRAAKGLPLVWPA